jgi:hypothetical protein
VPVSVEAAFGLDQPHLSPDGGWLAWSGEGDGKQSTFVAPTGEPSGREVCRDCRAFAFLSGASELLVSRGRRLTRLRVADGGERPVLDLGQEQPPDADVSADEHWVALSTGRPDGHLALRVFRLDAPPDSLEKGIPITDGVSWTSSPRWAPEGRLLYYLSDRDGFLCVWATPLDPRTKRPSGEPFPVLHAHRKHMEMLLLVKWLFEIAVSPDVGRRLRTIGPWPSPRAGGGARLRPRRRGSTRAASSPCLRAVPAAPRGASGRSSCRACRPRS